MAVVSTIRKQFPFIEDLSVEYHGGTAIVHAKLRSMSESANSCPWHQQDAVDSRYIISHAA